jgi:glycosyltransferase involved in cell wall biosynthesis
MHVLFVQVSRQRSPEYGNHRRHAQYAGDGVEAFFFRQSPEDYAPLQSGFRRDASGEHYFFEFGRNLALHPRPSRLRRALLMAVAIPLNLPRLLRAARRLQPDVIYTSQQRLDVPVGLLLSRLLHVPHVIALHYPVGPWLGRLTLALILRSRRLIAISEYVRQTAIEQGADPQVIHVVHNSIDTAPFADKGGRGTVRRELAIPESAPLITSIGRLDPGKGHLELLQALARLREPFQEARLLICGRTFTRDHYDDYLQAEAERLGLAERVIFAGFRRDIPAVLAASDIFCLPSHEEAFGMVYLEAMASGLPIVAYRAGGVPEIVVHGETGLLAERDDIEGLAGHLEQLLTDCDLARRMGDAGYKRVHEQFVSEVRAPHWAKTVRKLVESQPAR